MNQDLATRIIESLRSGIPTRESTRNLISSPSRIHRRFNDDLTLIATSNHVPKGHLIRGGFGQGKTHELISLEHKALDRGFAVSRVTLNRQLSGQRMDSLYSKLAASIRTPQSKLFGIRHVLDKKKSSDLLNSPIHDVDRYIHPLPAIILETYLCAPAEDQDLLYGALLGCSIPSTTLRDIYRQCFGSAIPKFTEKFTPAKHSKAYFQTMADVLRWCGYHGWVILIDEIELTYRLSKQSKLKAYQNFYWLLNWSESQTFPIYTVGAITDSTIALWSEIKGKNQQSDIDIITNLALEKCGTESQQDMIRFFQYAQDDEICPTVGRMDKNSLIELLTQISEIHGISYGWIPDINIPDVVERQGNQPIRLYIRALMETLDMRYLGDRQYIPTVTGLEQTNQSEDDSYFDEEDS
jgi:hypothetical protein